MIVSGTGHEKVTREVAAKIPFLDIVGQLNVFFTIFVRPYIRTNDPKVEKQDSLWLNPSLSSKSASLSIYFYVNT